MSNYAIEVSGLGKEYVLGAARERHDSLRDLITARVGSLMPPWRSKRQAKKTFWALNDASFKIEHGENVGIVGMNGAGKSTLLKILSRITEPTSGVARINGRVGALLEVGTGFHGELTGRENVFLYGSILGMRKEEVQRKFAAIAEFAGIEKFMDTPVKRYSSGMYVRLAFAVAAHLEPEILLLDEVLAVGDVAFQKKCMNFAKDLQRRNATILFVSHNMFSIKTMCERVIYLKKGSVFFDGPTDQGIEIYERDCQLAALPWIEGRAEDKPIKITECALLDDSGTPKTVFDFGERMKMRIAYDAKKPLKDLNVIVSITRSDGVSVCNFSSETDGTLLTMVDGPGVVELHTPPLKLTSERYTASILIREKGFQDLLCGQVGAIFHIRHELFDTHFGVFHEQADWKWLPGSASA